MESLFCLVILLVFGAHVHYAIAEEVFECLLGACASKEMASSRVVERLIKAVNVSDGAGVKLKRTIGALVDYVDPFLLLDEFKSESRGAFGAGFPDHPHRGFETVSYILSGSIEHRDHKGNHGILTSGSIQWMTAGRGIIHSEMPVESQEDGIMWGFQLWVNLPAKDKMCEPRYQDIAPSAVPVLTVANATIRVLAGSVGEVTGPVIGVVTNPTYLDITVPPSGHYTHTLPLDHTAFVYVFDGEGSFGPTDNQTIVPINTLAVFKHGDKIEAKCAPGAAKSVRFLLVGAHPLNEPMARRGPFVMNTREEIMQAFVDYQSGKF